MTDSSSAVVEAYMDELFPPKLELFEVDGVVAESVPITYADGSALLVATVIGVAVIYAVAGALAACYSPGCAISTDYIYGLANANSNPVEALGPHPSLDSLATLRQRLVAGDVS